MTEADISAHLIGLSDLTLTGLSVIFTMLSAYIAALYFFLHAAPALLRLAAFGLLTFVMAYLAIFSLGTASHAAGLHAALREIGASPTTSPWARTQLDGAITSARIGEALGWLNGVGLSVLYAGLAYLTFFYRWRRA